MVKVVALALNIPVGVPLIVTEFVVLDPSASPEGRLPATTAQVYGGVPPLAASVALYAIFCVAFGSTPGVIERGEGAVAEASGTFVTKASVPPPYAD